MSGHQLPGASPLRVVRAVIVAMLVFTFAQALAGPAVAGDVAPTEAPTEVPTEAPTEVPTEAPTEVPTEQPTQAATEPSTDEQIKVAAILCNDWSCHEFGDRIDGFTITAIDIDTRESLGSCVTDVSSEFEGCWLEIPAGAHWTLTFDDDETPEGYIYHGSIIAVSGGAYGEIIYVPFHPLVDPEPGHMVVQAALCTDASCDEYEKYLDNFLISAVNPETGQEYSECMTDNAQQNLDHQCILDVPAKGLVELQWVEDQVPDGYVPFGEPITAGEPAVTTLAFVPEDDAPPATEAPVTSLPVTGAGTEGNRPLGAVVLATVLLGILGAALVTGSRTRHR